MKWLSGLIGILLSIHAFADGVLSEPSSLDQPWSITASFGNSKYQNSINESAVGRLALGNDLLLTGDYLLGLELGLQNGHRLKFDVPAETLAVLEWLPVHTTLGPMLDLLITAKSDPLVGSNFFAQLKGGVAYRYWEANHPSVNDLSQLAGEIQAGFGYPITALATLSLLYQGVFGNDPDISINTVTKTASVSNIPSLHAVLLGFTVNL